MYGVMGNNIKLSPHFRRSEFSCGCGCGRDTVDYELLRLLETIREHFMQPVTITSGYRCEAHNSSQAVKGSKKSQHLYGRAADFKVKNVNPEQVYDFIDAYAPNKWGLGLYSSWVHVDTRSGPMARWDYS